MIVTFDSNLLVYAILPGPVDKSERARELILRSLQGGECLLLLQTLAEFTNVAIGKGAIPPREVQAIIDLWRAALPVHAAEPDDLATALEAVRRHRFAFWDAMMWATAHRLGVRYLLTEDMQDGFVLDGVSFLNPFLAANDDLIDEILPVG